MDAYDLRRMQGARVLQGHFPRWWIMYGRWSRLYWAFSVGAESAHVLSHPNCEGLAAILTDAERGRVPAP